MLKGLIGKKIGMTQIFDEKGVAFPVTIIEAGPCYVTQVRTLEKEGYAAVQLGFGELHRPCMDIRDGADEAPALDCGGHARNIRAGLGGKQARIHKPRLQIAGTVVVGGEHLAEIGHRHRRVGE